MKRYFILLATLTAIILSGCDHQSKITAVEIGCHPEEIAFDGRSKFVVLEYWEATCKGKRYACRPTTGIPIFQAQSAKCTEITSADTR